MSEKLFRYFAEGITVVVILYEICRTDKRSKRRF